MKVKNSGLRQGWVQIVHTLLNDTNRLPQRQKELRKEALQQKRLKDKK